MDTFTISSSGETTKVFVIKPLTGYTALSLKTKLSDLIQRVHGDIVIDMTDSEDIDLAGTNALISMTQAMDRSQRLLSIQARKSSGIEKVLRLTSFKSLLNLEYTA